LNAKFPHEPPKYFLGYFIKGQDQQRLSIRFSPAYEAKLHIVNIAWDLMTLLRYSFLTFIVTSSSFSPQ